MRIDACVQVAAFIAHLAALRNNWGPYLIVTSSAAAHTWQTVFATLCPGLAVMTGMDAQATGWHVCLVDYASASKHRAWLGSQRWKCVFVDELQNVSNLCCPELYWLDALNTKRRFLLSRSPLSANAWSLTSLVHFVYPRLLASLSPLGWWFSAGNAAIMAAVQEDGAAGLDDDVVAKMQQLLAVCTLNSAHANWEDDVSGSMDACTPPCCS